MQSSKSLSAPILSQISGDLKQSRAPRESGADDFK